MVLRSPAVAPRKSYLKGIRDQTEAMVHDGAEVVLEACRKVQERSLEAASGTIRELEEFDKSVI